MDLFNFLKKSNNTNRSETLSLEELLEKASNDPKYRPEFYDRLLTDDLVTIVADEHLQKGEYTLEKVTTVRFVSYSDGKIPVFTSTDRIFDKGVIKEQVNFMAMKGRNLFETAVGATFLLNPYSDYGKELLPNEIQQMLDGTINKRKGEHITIEKETQVQIGQPAVYPTKLIDGLKYFFATRPNVKAAYLGWIFDPASGQPPHYIFGLYADGDWKSLSQESEAIASDYLKPDEFVDFFKIDGGEGLSGYFTNDTEPFYKR
ncbi:enhanced serine sensitivity protein SseB C-terminal domain-containing protein [Sphingobacterium corticis]|uniref:Enhanced serine sensitivity protein SseB C-terminal domain-containing protein n=1 Tax=Sphingobacterium corticis TaxID=1812823 RepID=A0ABW5NEQ3_9SPHI